MFKGFGKKTRFLVGILLIAGLMAVVGCGGSEKKTDTAKEDVKPVTLNLAHIWPATHDMETVIAQGWGKAIEEATDGQVKIVSYPASTLIPATEVYDGVSKGVADIGISVYAYNRGKFPVVESFLLPGLSFNNSEAATLALAEGIEKLDPQELKDTKQMFSFAAGPGDLLTKKPIRKLADVKGMQLGASAGLRADAVQLLGATPVVQPMTDWYESLSKGIMSGGIAPVETLQGFRLGEVTGDYITLTPFLYNQAFYVVMNNDKWNSLPADVQKAITEVNKKFLKETVAPLFNGINQRAFKAAKAKKNVEVITLSDQETALWVEKLQPLEANYVKTLNEKGLKGEDIMKTVKELTDKYNGQYPEKAVYTK